MLPDGGNLYLQVARDRTHPDRIHRSWVFRYELDGRRHDLGLGPLHTLDLADARQRAKTLRQQLLDGVDPLEAKQQAKRDRLARLAAEQRAMTFRHNARKHASLRTKTAGRIPSTAPNGRKACKTTPTRCSAISPLTT